MGPVGMKIAATLLVGLLVGLVFMKIKLPGGLLIGAIAGVAVLNVITAEAYIWPQSRVLAQALTGAFIGCKMTRENVRKLPKIIGPYSLIMSSFLLLNICVGLIIYRLTDLDLLTCFLCAMPGGMTDTPLIALDMGADSASVALLQFVRMMFGLSCLPSIIAFSDRKFFSKKDRAPITPAAKGASKEATFLQFLPTLLVALLFGVIGKLAGTPAGAMLFSLVAVSVLRAMGKAPTMPLYLRRVAQVLSGCCIGCTITAKQLASLSQLALPAVIICVAFVVLCLAMGTLVSKIFHIDRREAMLFLSPAGAAEMTLIAADIGVESTDLAVLQVGRLVGVLVVFPQVFHFIVQFL